MLTWLIIVAVLLGLSAALLTVLLLMARAAPLAPDEPEPQSDCEPPAQHQYERQVPRYLSVVLLAVALTACSAQAGATSLCADQGAMAAALAREHHERPTDGAVSAGRLVEVYRTATGSTWTIVVTDGARRSCIVAFGKWWGEVPDPFGAGMPIAEGALD